MRFKIIPARAYGDAFFLEATEEHAMAVASEIRDSCRMSVVVVEHPVGGTIRHAGTAEYREPKVKRAA